MRLRAGEVDYILQHSTIVVTAVADNRFTQLPTIARGWGPFLYRRKLTQCSVPSVLQSDLKAQAPLR